MPEVAIDPSILSRDSAVGKAHAADELVYHGGFHRGTLEAIFAGARTVQWSSWNRVVVHVVIQATSVAEFSLKLAGESSK
jgi:hypothetical protein